MRRAKKQRIEAAATTACRLQWHLSRRCDGDVAKAITMGEEIDGVYQLDYVGLFTGFLAYLRLIGLWATLAALKAAGRQRHMVETLVYVLIYMEKLIAGLPSGSATEEVLLTDQGAMRAVGFNAIHVKEGVCRRGEDRRKNKGAKGRPIGVDAMNRHFCRIAATAMVDLFNRAVQCLAARGVFPKEVTVALDPTDVETPDGFAGAGSVTRQKRPGKRGKAAKVSVTVWGFRLILVMETKTRIPVAAKLVQIQENGIKHWRQLVRQARKNLKGYATVRAVVADREFVDGEIMWWVDSEDMAFVIPGKTNMDVTHEARQRVKYARDGTFADGAMRHERTMKVKRGQGKNQRIEEQKTVVWGVEGLVGMDTYGPTEEAAKKHRRNGRGRALNAVVVEAWDGKPGTPGEEVVFLTNLPVMDALRVFDLYDERSLIEVPLNKEAKQNWHLEHAPMHTRNAMSNHVFMVLALMATTRAYRAYQERLETDPDEKRPATDPLGFRRWRRQVLNENADKVIVFVGEKFAILPLEDFCILASPTIRIRGAPPRTDVLARYGVVLTPGA
jgi:hypothetical protein